MKLVCRISMVSIALLLTFACKRKVESQKEVLKIQDSQSNGPAIPEGEWKGQDDKIDPALGKLKALD